MTTKKIYLPIMYVDDATGEIIEKSSLKNLVYKTIKNEQNIEKNGTIKKIHTIKTIRIVGQQGEINFS